MALQTVQAEEFNERPLRQIVLIFSEYNDGSAVLGTGLLVGTNDVLTAVHVIYQPEKGGWADSIQLHFGENFNSETNQLRGNGSSYKPSQWYFFGWAESHFRDSDNINSTPEESAYDLAIIGIDAEIGETRGFVEMTNNYWPFGQTDIEVFGYSDGFSSLTKTEGALLISPSAFPEQARIDTQFFSGASGGPVINNEGRVLGVLSASGVNRTNVATVGDFWEHLANEIYLNDHILDDWNPAEINLGDWVRGQFIYSGLNPSNSAQSVFQVELDSGKHYGISINEFESFPYILIFDSEFQKVTGQEINERGLTFSPEDSGIFYIQIRSVDLNNSFDFEIFLDELSVSLIDVIATVDGTPLYLSGLTEKTSGPRHTIDYEQMTFDF